MQKSEVKTIAFKGIERVNERINCNPGACEEIINLRPEGNTWRNIGRRKRITKKGLSVVGDIDYSVIIHSASKDDYFIVWDKTHGKVVLYDKQTENAKRTLLGKSNIISISYLDNVLVICTDEEKYYFLYDEQKKDYKSVSLQNISAHITAKSNPLIKKESYKNKTINTNDNKTSEETNIYDYGLITKFLPKNIYTIYRTRKKGVVTDYNELKNLSLDKFTEASKSFINGAEENIRRGKGINNIPINECRKIFKGLSFYRVAFKLYDGNYSNYSNISYSDTNGEDAGMNGYGSFLNGFPMSFRCTTNGIHYIDSSSGDYQVDLRCIAAYNPFGTHKIFVELNNLEEIKSLMDDGIIQSVDIFMTRPIFSVDFDKDIVIKNTYAETLIGGNGTFVPGDEIYGYGNFEGVFPRNDEGIRQQLLSGTYFKVKSFDKDEIEKNINGKLEYEVVYDDIKTIEASEILPTPTTDNEVLFGNSYNYNQKQHIYDIIYNIFNGYDLPKDDVQNGAFDSLKNDVGLNGKGDLCYTIAGEYNGNNFAIKHKINNPDLFIESKGNKKYAIKLPTLFSYPIIEKVTFGVGIIYDNNKEIKLYEKSFNNIFGGGNTDFICELKNKDVKTFEKNITPILIPANHIVDIVYITTYQPKDDENDSHFNDLSVEIDATKLKETTFIEKNRTQSKNILQLTETDNPFVLPSAENYTFGEKGNDILAISSNSGLITDRNFGTYPLYVFTSDGIFTMSVGNGEIAYSNIIQVNTMQVINKNVLNIPLGVMLLSKRGLCIINGEQNTCISDFVKGKPTITNNEMRARLIQLAPYKFDYITLTKIKDLNAIVDLNILTTIDDDFLDEIKESQFYYDELHNEVCIVVKDKYTYVYNLSLNVFYKRSDCLTVENWNTLSTKEVYQQSVGNRKLPTIEGSNGLLRPNKVNTSVVDKNRTLIHIYSIDEELTDKDDICRSIAIITKPFLLDTRSFKNIERIIFDMSWRDEDEFYLVLFGSRDGVNYNIVKKCIKQSNDNGKEHQDIYLDLVQSSAKYFFLCICSRKFFDERIAYVMFQFKQTRNMGGIR